MGSRSGRIPNLDLKIIRIPSTALATKPAVRPDLILSAVMANSARRVRGRGCPLCPHSEHCCRCYASHASQLGRRRPTAPVPPEKAAKPNEGDCSKKKDQRRFLDPGDRWHRKRHHHSESADLPGEAVNT